MLFFLPALVAPAPIQVTLDAREVSKHVVHVQLSVPVKPGPITLSYPKWIPGMHEPVGPVQNVVKLRFSAGGKALSWRRDPFDVYSFQVTVPKGAERLEASFDYLPRVGDTDEIAYGVAATENLAVINPSALLLCPRDADVGKTPVTVSYQLPESWLAATSLPESGATLERLADSPIFAGKYRRTISLPSPDGVEHTLAVFGESAEGATPNEHVLSCMRKLVVESAALFGARHYSRFTFLLALTPGLPQYGLEHHESTVNVLRPGALGDGVGLPGQWNANLLSHEYVHSWNGKHRRPYGLANRSFNQPLSTDLLWVYEGLTEYLGEVLMVRCGFYPLAAEREHLRQQLASLDSRQARMEQSLRDAAVAFPLISAKGDGRRLRLSNDVYYESALHWLEADTLIREKTGGKRSLDDFCRTFFGGVNRGPEVRPYVETDVVAALTTTVPGIDWAAWLVKRFDALEPLAPRTGLERAGWKLGLGEVGESRRFEAEYDYRYSLGFQLGRDGRVTLVEPQTPAATAGVVVGARLVSLNGTPVTAAGLRTAVQQTKTQAAALTLGMEAGGLESPVVLHYQGGERLPVLIREENQTDLLSVIFSTKIP